MTEFTHAESAVLAHIIAAIPERFPYWRIHQTGMPQYDASAESTRAAIRSLRASYYVEKDGPFLRIAPGRPMDEMADVIATVHSHPAVNLIANGKYRFSATA